MDIADRVVLMKNGQISKDMNIRDFLNLPTERIKRMGLRCRDFSEIEACTNVKGNSERFLELKDIAAKYEKRTVIQNVSFTAGGGEIIAITGENGAGKTTLARTVCGLIKESSGSISVNGRKLSSKERIKKSYMVMQDVGHQLFTDLFRDRTRTRTRYIRICP